MRILIDIGHPGHVHLFRPFAHKMIKNGHAVLFTCREKEFEIELLKGEGFQYKSFGKKYKHIIGKIWGVLKFDLLELITALKFKPDVFLSHGSPYAAHAAFFLRKKNVALEDTGNAEQVKLYLPFTSTVLTSNSFHKQYGKKQIRYNGFHELAYLHPNHFLSNKKVLEELNLKEGETFFFIRFVSWNASHDFGEKGLKWQEKISLINYLLTKGKIIISSEKELPEEFQQYNFKLHPSKVHDVMSYATLFIGEGATMASECALLGTPAIYINSMEAGTINEQEKNHLVYHFRNGKGVLEKVIELINTPNLKARAQKTSTDFISQKIDVTAFLVWFIENYPKSIAIMKNNPDYQYNFK